MTETREIMDMLEKNYGKEVAGDFNGSVTSEYASDGAMVTNYHCEDEDGKYYASTFRYCDSNGVPYGEEYAYGLFGGGGSKMVKNPIVQEDLIRISNMINVGSLVLYKDSSDADIVGLKRGTIQSKSNSFVVVNTSGFRTALQYVDFVIGTAKVIY